MAGKHPERDRIVEHEGANSSDPNKIADHPLRHEERALSPRLRGSQGLYEVVEDLPWKWDDGTKMYRVRGIGEGPRTLKVESKKDVIVHVGIDTEYVLRDAESESPWNEVISIQLWMLELNEGLIILPERGRREKLRFSKVVETVDRWVRETLGKRRHGGRRYRFIAHYSQAEFRAGLSIREDVESGWLPVDQRQKSIVTARKEGVFEYYDNRNAKQCKVTIHDTTLLSPGRLSALGKDVGAPKVELGEGWIEKMDQLFIEDTALYLDYAMHDAWICAVWFSRFFEFVNQLLPIGEDVPVSTSQLGQWFVESKIEDVEEDFSGKERKTKYDYRSGKYKSVLELPEELLQYGLRAYYGGRNEVFRVGAFHGDVFDYDLVSAYPTAVLCLDDVDWQQPEYGVKLEDLAPNDVGYARVRFSFRKDVWAPMFPIQAPNDRGLIFPRIGTTTLSLSEVWTASKNGMLEELELQECVRYVRRDSRRLAKALAELVLARRSLPKSEKKGLQDRMLKLTANSIYGKTAQGIQEKTGFDLEASIRKGDPIRKQLPRGKLCAPLIAAAITGICRSLVGEYIHQLTNRGMRILSVTTDGFMLREEIPESLLHGQDLPLGTWVRNRRNEVLGNDEPLIELKHHVHEGTTLVIKNRMYWMIDWFRNHPKFCGHPLLAKGGVQTPKGLSTDEAIDHMTSLFREKADRSSVSYDPPLDEYIQDDADFIKVTMERSINWDYDLKRQIDEKSITNVQLHSMWDDFIPSYNTRPWETLQDYIDGRENRYRNFGRDPARNRNKLLTRDDVEEFCAYEQLRTIADGKEENARVCLIFKIIKALDKMGHRPAEISRLITVLEIPTKEIADILRGKDRGIRRIPVADFPDLVSVFNWVMTGVSKATREEVRKQVFV